MIGPEPQPVVVDKAGVYLVVSDLPHADRFYRDLFGKPPVFTTGSVVVFDLAGSPFVLFVESASDILRTRGNTCVPYLRVPDIDATYAAVAARGVRMLDSTIVKEGPIQLFRIADPDDNIVEFYSVAMPPKA